MAKYTVEQKLEILDAWKKQEISRAAIARKYGVASQMIRQWEKKGLYPETKYEIDTQVNLEYRL